MSSLSVIVITKNEERNIEECLNSVRWAYEIVLVDGGSTDKTLELARKFTEKVFVKPWEGYGASKNFALEHCRGDWVLWLDADERVTDDLGKEIQAVMDQAVTPFTVYEIPRKAFFLGKWIRHCGWYPGYVARLFKPGAGRFSDNKVHERFEFSGAVGKLRFDLLHYTDPNLWHYFEKFNRYTSLAADELMGKKAAFRISQLVVRPVWVFVRMYVVKLGFLDGIQGFILSVLSSCYVFTKYAKLWELSTGIERGKP
ncbi:MAG: glycosyltransferase family 2 protein [Ignavibacteriales bacterium]|nr:glycosyltransferase family 2 protein [Ignavibacteriales bacterium]